MACGKYMKVITYLVLFFIAASVFFSGCTAQTIPDATVLNTRYLGGEHNITVYTLWRQDLHNATWTEFEYTVNGKTERGDFVEDYVPAYEFLKSNTSPDSIITCWWDYGHSIRGWSGRGPVVDSPSAEIANSVSPYMYMSDAEKKEFRDEFCTAPYDKTKDIAAILTADNPQDAIALMEKYGSDYLFVADMDLEKSPVFLSIADKQNVSTDSPDFNKLVIRKALKGENIDGFELVYSGSGAHIYKII